MKIQITQSFNKKIENFDVKAIETLSIQDFTAIQQALIMQGIDLPLRVMRNIYLI